MHALAYFRSASSTALVVSYHEGQTLTRAVKGREGVASRAMGLMRMLLSALRHLHDHQVVHCDVKPDNLIVSKRLWPLKKKKALRFEELELDLGGLRGGAVGWAIDANSYHHDLCIA